MSKPSVLVAVNSVPETAINLLRERFVAKNFLFDYYSYVIFNFRFNVEILNGFQSNHKEILEKIPGKFGIFCVPSIKIDEEVIKTAGENIQ